MDLPRYLALLERAVNAVLAPIQQSVYGGVDSECMYLFPPPQFQPVVRLVEG